MCPTKKPFHNQHLPAPLQRLRVELEGKRQQQFKKIAKGTTKTIKEEVKFVQSSLTTIKNEFDNVKQQFIDYFDDEEEDDLKCGDSKNNEK